MKNKLSLLSLGVVALFVASCSDDDLGSSSRSANAILTASVEGYSSNTPSTRAGFSKPTDNSNNYPFYWSKGDEIGVTSFSSSSSSESPVFSSLTLTSGEGTGNGSFASTIFSGTVGNYAVYPMNEEHKLTFDGTSATKLTYYYKPSYEYTTVNQSFYDADGTPTGTLQSWYPAMFAKIESGNATFKHLGGVICVKYPAMPAESGVFILKANNGKAITGKFDVDISSFSKDNPVKIETVDVPTSDNTNSYGNEVKITFSGASKDNPGVFYVPVPVGTYDVYLIMKSSDESSTLGTAYEGGVEISRQSLYGIILGNATITGNSSVQTLSGTDAASEDGIKTALGSNDAVVIDAAVTDPKIVIPETSSSSSDTETSKTVILNQVTSGSTITLSDGNTDTSYNGGGKSVNNVTVSLPTSATATTDGGSETVTAPSLEVTLPNTTVTVEANTGSTTIETATVETADNTFIVGSGVTINTLNVKKGNVILKSGSKVKAIAATSDNSGTVHVYFEDKSSCPDNYADSDKVKFGVRGGLDELKKYAVDGGTLDLTEDVTLDGDIRIAKALTLNLNDHKINVPSGYRIYVEAADGESKINLGTKGEIVGASNCFLRFLSKATISGGTITSNAVPTEKVDNPSTVLVDNGGDLTVDGVKVVSTNGSGLFIYPDSGKKASLTVNSATVNAKYYALSGNGLAGDCTVDVKDGTYISSDDYAIYLPQPGTTTITKGSFTGAAGAVAIQRGTLTINGGTYVSNGTATVDVTASGDGTAGLYNATLAIIARYGNLTANINGGTFTAKGNATTVTATHNKVVTEFTKDVNVKAAATFSDLSILTAASDSTYDLSGDLTLANDLTVSTLSLSGKKSVIVDLNGKTLTSSQTGSSVINFSEATDAITYKNGTIAFSQEADGSDAVTVYKGSLFLDKVIFNAKDWHTAISAQNHDAYVKISNSSSVTGRYFGMSTNASTDGQNLVYGKGANIELENSTFNSKETGFMNNVPATINMTGCTFSGNHQGALLRGGTYTITGCTFTLNAELAPTHWECHNNSSWADGNRTAYAAIVIGNRSDTAYRYTTTVTFEGDKNTGVVTGTNASSFPAAYAWGVSGDAYKVTITGNMAGFRNSANYDFVYGGNVDVSGATLPSNIKQASGTNGGENASVSGSF